MAFLTTSSIGGYKSGASGSPGDFNSTCADCHGGGSFKAAATITTDIPAGGYALNTKYNVSVTMTSSSARQGFQLTVENASGTKVGLLAAGTGSQIFRSGLGITHTSNGNSLKTWSFTWTSPSTDKGAVTFYSALVASNSNSSDSGDQVITTKLQVPSATTLGVNDFLSSQLTLYPNPASQTVNLDLPSIITSAIVLFHDYLGRVVSTQEILGSQSTLDLNGLAKGVYYLSIKTAEGTASKTLIVN